MAVADDQARRDADGSAADASAVDGGAADGGAVGRAWLAGLPADLRAQRRVMTGLVDFCEATPLATAFLVGCSLGRGAADALSDIDAGLGVAAAAGDAGAAEVEAVEAEVAVALPGIAPVIDMLRHRYGPADRLLRRIFAQFADGTQLDLVVMADTELRARGSRPDFVMLYEQGRLPDTGTRDAAYTVTGEQIREWAFLGWCALIDLDKYLRRGSLWEAYDRLNDARHQIWALWAAATGAMYPWHGLTQVLDNDPGNLPPGIESTVVGLDAGQLRSAASACAEILASVSDLAARRWPADLPSAMADYVSGVLAGTLVRLTAD
jgi:hypothetical protein